MVAKYYKNRILNIVLYVFFALVLFLIVTIGTNPYVNIGIICISAIGVLLTIGAVNES